MEKGDDDLSEILGFRPAKLPPKHYHNLRPALPDIRFSNDLLLDTRLEWLDDQDFRIFMRLVGITACSNVWTYSPPIDGWLKEDDARLIKLLGVNKKKWNKAKATLIDSGLINIVDGRIVLDDRFYSIEAEGRERPPMPSVLRMAILRRDNFTCGYCGEANGPFDVDHIVPIARGGSNLSEDNLICACARCNRSKGAKTVEEWLG